MNFKCYDTVVVGAGPAGATTARKLAQEGQAVLLMDQANFPRDKHCGGLISIKALEALDHEIPTKIICNSIYQITLYSHKMKSSVYDKGNVLGVTVDRKEFDQYLLTKAIGQGVNFYKESKFLYLEKEKEGIKVFTSQGVFKCKTLVGCDGIHSKIKKYVNKDSFLNDYAKGFAVSQLIGTNGNIPKDFKLFSLPIPFSMGWAIPKGNEVNVGLGGPAFYNKKIIKYMSKYVEDIKKIYPGSYHRNEVRASFLPAGGFVRKIQRDNILLAGDAAGFVDPLTGEGVYYAIITGKLAAEKIISNRLTDYEESCYRFFHKQLRDSLIFNLISYKKGYTEISIMRERLCRKFGKMIQDYGIF